MTEIRHERVSGDGVWLHVARAGAGPPVILLHGFPENWRAWRHQIPALAAAGFTVQAVDQRGYNDSDRPGSREAYHLSHLVADVAAVVRGTGAPRAHIVGHDWGGIVAWTFAGTHPELLDKLVILNAPHLDIYMKRLQRLSRQWLRSWYVALFRVPGLAETVLSSFDHRLIRRMFITGPARPAFSATDVDYFVAALARPGALTAALDWYRANARGDAIRLARAARVAAPTLVVWGERDPALGLDLLEGLERVAPGARIHRIPGASHWVQNEEPGEVNRVLLEFLREA